MVHGDRVIVLYDNEEESWLAALDKHTGEELWRTPPRRGVDLGDTLRVGERAAHRDRDLGGPTASAPTTSTGRLLWEMDGRMSWAAIPTPFASEGLVYVNSGYFRDEHRPAYAVRPGASGDISLRDGEQSNEFVAWYQPPGRQLQTPRR